MRRSISQNENVRNSFITLTCILTGKGPLGRLRRRWKDNIIKDLKEISINTGNSVDSAQSRDYWGALVNMALKLRIP